MIQIGCLQLSQVGNEPKNEGLLSATSSSHSKLLRIVMQKYIRSYPNE
ncbi:unnamed protein product [Coffea canephora]|uniref:DH200=94 genomic scaffold, scaffold_2072 n=1 Tax=Coffea canephora TaxID=49390 RepID=A0A068VJZ9_COFCA|nr:unnamed protein product [Coffea canephora]